MQQEYTIQSCILTIVVQVMTGDRAFAVVESDPKIYNHPMIHGKTRKFVR